MFIHVFSPGNLFYIIIQEFIYNYLRRRFFFLLGSPQQMMFSARKTIQLYIAARFSSQPYSSRIAVVEWFIPPYSLETIVSTSWFIGVFWGDGSSVKTIFHNREISNISIYLKLYWMFSILMVDMLNILSKNWFHGESKGFSSGCHDAKSFPEAYES